MSKIRDLRQERAGLHEEMRAMLEAGKVEGADPLDTATYDRMEARFDELGQEIGRLERAEARTKELAAVAGSTTYGRDQEDEPITGKNFRAHKRYTTAFWQASRMGATRVGPDIYAALEVGTNSEGGYIVPVEFETMLIVALEQYNELRSVATVIQTASERRIPVESDDGQATWTDEEAAYTESDVAFSQVVLGAYKLARIIKVSEELLRDSFFDLPSYIANNFGRTFGYAEEAAFVNGDGTGKPTGIIPGASAGITAAATAAITSDEVIDLYHALKRPYRRNATWLMADGTVKVIRKLKTSDGQYLWQPGLQAGEPDAILGRPTIASDAVPAMAAGAKPIVFGDMSYYTVADRTGREMQRLNELFAATGQIGFKMNERLDGKVTLAEAIKVLTMAAS